MLIEPFSVVMSPRHECRAFYFVLSGNLTGFRSPKYSKKFCEFQRSYQNFICGVQIIWGHLLRSWHETQEFEFLQFWLCHLCAWCVHITLLGMLITQKYGPRRFQRRVASYFTTKARFCSSNWNNNNLLWIWELFESVWASRLENHDHQQSKNFRLL